jgi:hypothetical protein
MQRWLKKAAVIQWDFRNITKCQRKLKKIGTW